MYKILLDSKAPGVPNMNVAIFTCRCTFIIALFFNTQKVTKTDESVKGAKELDELMQTYASSVYLDTTVLCPDTS